MSYLENLNEQQKQAVTSLSKYIRVNAGAGSGKTTVLAYRIVDLIVEKGVSENQIIAFTFTNKVATEMKKRVLNYLQLDKTYAHISTFHSFCNSFLRQEYRALKNYSSSFCP
jgi:DNA helicase-2/ATP-dependent DNA helicase PcrA